MYEIEIEVTVKLNMGVASGYTHLITSGNYFAMLLTLKIPSPMTALILEKAYNNKK